MTTPQRDNFYMPAEYAPHAATIMIWCERGGSWIYGARYARPVFAEMIAMSASCSLFGFSFRPQSE